MYEVLFRREPYQEQELEVRMHSKDKRVSGLLGQQIFLFACCYMSQECTISRHIDHKYVSVQFSPNKLFIFLTSQDKRFTLGYSTFWLQGDPESELRPMRRNSQFRPVRQNSMLRPKWTQAEAACFPIELIGLMQTCWCTVSSVQNCLPNSSTVF